MLRRFCGAESSINATHYPRMRRAQGKQARMRNKLFTPPHAWMILVFPSIDGVKNKTKVLHFKPFVVLQRNAFLFFPNLH